MFGYYLDLATRSLKRNPVLISLMVMAPALRADAVPPVVATRSV